MNVFVRLFLSLLSGLLISTVQAGDVDAGKAKSATCVACHGPGGASINPEWPNLAGQNYGYLVAQITAFRDGVRQNVLMAPMVNNLSDADIDDLASYFSSIDIPQPANPAPDALGRNEIATCTACHGSLGHPVNNEWPILAGQQAVYIANQLKAFRDTSRKHLLMEQMAAPLSDQQIQVIAEFYHKLK